MSPTPKRTRITRVYHTRNAASPARRFIAQVVAFMLLAQTIAPPAIAAPAHGFSLASLRSGASSLAAVLGKLGGVAPATSAQTVSVRPAAEEFGVVLTPLSTAFAGHAGIEHHQPLRKVVVSSNNPSGVPLNFETLDADGTHRPHSNIAGLTGGLKLATARDDGAGMSRGGFTPGELFSATGAPGVIARVASGGASVRNPWVTLAGESGQLSGGMFLDRTGVFGGDLIAVTSTGSVWRINSAGVAARIADLNTALSGVTTIPDDVARYGPWAGKILAGAKEQGAVYAIDAQGNSTSYQLGLNPEDIRVIPAHENFYGVDAAGGKIWGAPDDAFAGIIGDIVIAQGSPGVLARVRWNGTEFEVGQLATVSSWEQITFSPAALSEIGGVKQVYDKIAVVRHAPELDSGRVEGALWQLLPENVALNGTDVITSDLLLPGTPTVTVSGKSSFNGIIEGVESTLPSGYSVSISNNAILRHVITRTDPISLAPVSVPPAPAGTRDVSLSKAGEAIGDAVTLRNLSISGKAGAVAVPPGTYGKFTATGHTQFVFGVEGANTPSVYDLEDLSLSGGSELRLAGPVRLNVRGNVSLSGSTVGAADNPQRLLLSVAQGAVGVTGNGVLYGIVRIPQGMVTISGNGRIRGTVTCDRLNIFGNGVLQITESDVAPPPVNRPPTADAGPDQTITLPTDVVSLNGTATDDSLPAGSTLVTNWTKVSGPGTVAFSAPGNPVTTATFGEAGIYVLRLSANDSLLTAYDEMTVEVVPRNQPPVVNAGPDQSIELPNTAALNGTASDDALPRGSTLTTSWSTVSGPGTVTFGSADRAATTAIFSAPGTYVLRLAASDTEQIASDDVIVTVLPKPNLPPHITSAPVVEFTPGSAAYTYDVEASDPEGDALTYSLDAAPTGMTIDPATGLISWPVTPREAGAHHIVVRVQDPGGASDTQSYTLTIIDPIREPAFKVYTLNSDFDQGSYINVTRAVPDQLQLDETARTLNFIWVAVSSKGTVVKIDTETGAVLGEYFTSPAGQPRNPSRTTVDQNGNVWATNRDGNSVLHIGLVENGQCIDRNNNGVIDTSTGYGDIRPWTNAANADASGGVTTAQDECVIHYTKVNSSGTRHVSVNKDNDVWVSGTGGQRFDLIDGKTGLIKRSEPSVGYGGYGGLVDKNGVIWSARNLLRWDTSKPLTGANGVNWRGYGHDSYGLCIDSKGNVWNTALGGDQIYKFAPDGTHLGTFNHGAYYAQGCVVDKNDDVWVAHSLYDLTVGHLKNNGVFVGNVSVGAGPTGVAVDAKGKIWSTNHNSWTVSRIDPNLGPIGADGVTRVGQVDLTTRELGGNLYNYSDMTGSTLSGAPDQGTWSTVFDSQTAGAEWGRIGWTARVCGDGRLTVSVAGSEDGTNFSQPLVVSNGDDPDMPDGRYLKVIVKFERASSGESPILYDLTVGTAGFSLDTPPNVAPGVDAGPDQTLNDTTTTTLRASACDDALPSNQRLSMLWSQVSGPGTATFVKPNSPATDVAFSAPGTYRLRMTATDSEHTSSDTLVVNVIPGNQPPTVNAGTDQSIVLPASLSLSGTVTDDGLPSGGRLTATWSKLNGPGIATFGNINQPVTTVSFSDAGTYVLRLEASDSEKGTFDDVTVNVQPRLNGAPVITSEPATELSLGPAPAGAGELVDIGPWTVKQYQLNSQPAARWVKDVANNTATQIVNSDASILLSDFDLSHTQMDGTWRVDTTSDDDHIGFVFGYQNSEHFYLFDWKKGSQNDPLGFAERGMSVKVVNADSTLTGRDFWPTAGNGTRVRTLYHNTIPWQSFIDYHFTLQYFPGEIKITVRQGATVLSEIAVNDSTYTNGLFGFYNYSQSDVKYSGFRRLLLTQGTYTYDVEASDPDGDALTYSLTAAPSGMSINAATGLISWPVTSRQAGDHNITIRVQDPHGAFDTQSFTLTILNQNQSPTVSAGDDRTISINATATLNGSVTDDGLPRNAAVTSTWSMVSGPGLVAFADPVSPSTNATFSEAGTYVLRLTATDTALAASDETIITVTPPNQAPVVNAGADLTITQPGTARLNGTATNDGLPLGGTLAVRWSQVSGPGTATFANPVSESTTATFTDPGVYVLRLSASDTELMGTDDVIVTVNPTAPNQAPVVNASVDQTVTLNANLVQNAGNDEQLAGGEIPAWTEAGGGLWTRAVSGTGGFPESVNGDGLFYAGEVDSAELRQDIDVSAFAATIAAGSQSFEWKASVRSRGESVPDSARVILEYRNSSNTGIIAWSDSGEVSSVDAWRLLETTRPAPTGTGWIRLRLISTRRTGTTNDAYFDALSLRAVTGTGVKLSGTVTDDGLPAGGALATNWSKVSGPGTVTFAAPSMAQTSATFSAEGTYILRLSANDLELTSSDELTVTVEPRNFVPTVEAGADQTVTLPAAASLNGTVNDEGKPTGAIVTSRWSKVSGPGAVTFADPSAPVTTATFDAEGTYVLRLTASDTEYAGSDSVTITVNPVPSNFAPTVNAGADQLLESPATAAALSGTVEDDGRPSGSSLTYAWTKVSGPGAVTFSDPAALATTATFGEAGIYVLRLTADDTELTGTDDVRIRLNGTNKAPAVNAGADQALAHPKTVTLSGSATDDGLPIDSALSFNWSKVSGPGTVTFANAGAQQTTATFSAPGVYVLRLTASDTGLTGSDEVTITQTSPPKVGISSPTEGAVITDRTNFIGTIGEGSLWRLEYSLNEEGSAPVWKSFASGSAPVTNGLLGTFDPTLILNGAYTVRLVATNASGQTTTTALTLVVDGGQKVGNFRISFIDLQVPVAGIPIEVVRTYDSRDKRTGDFGVGWTLDVRNMRLQESGDVGAGWQAIVLPGFMPSYCLQPTSSHSVSITLPSNEVLRFEAVLGPQCSLLYPLGETTISYRAMPGTNAKLAPIGDTSVLVNASFPGEAELLDYSTFDEKDFDQYRLTLPSGETFVIDQRTGLREATDPNGNKLTINSNGITHSSGKSIAFTRDAQGRITRITDPAGNAMNYAYDAAGDLVSFTNRENEATAFTYDSTHGLLKITDPRGIQPLRNEYDQAGRLIRQIDAQGKIVNFSHEISASREVTTDRLGHATVNEYDRRGNIIRVVDSEGGVTTRTFDANDNLLTETNALGQTMKYTYDAQSNRLSQTDPLGQTTRYTYNGNGQVLSVTDPLGRVTTNTYDTRGNVTSTRDAFGHTTAATYDSRGLRTSITDALSHTTSFEYDSSGNLTKQTDALGRAVTYTYDANNKKLAQTQTRTLPGGAVQTLTTSFEYDRTGRVIKTVNPEGTTSQNVYNSSGQQIAVIDHLGRRVEWDYDATGRAVLRGFIDGTKEELAYDAEGRRIKRTDSANRITNSAYDALGRLRKITYPDGTSTATAYDAVGRVTSVTDARGNTAHYEYDAAGRRTKVTDPLGKTSTFTYDASNNQTSMTDAKGQTTRFEYDAADRPTKVIYPDGSTTTTTYDSVGREIAKTDQGGKTTHFEYDALDRLAKVTDALGKVTAYAYDEMGWLSSQTDANNHTTRFEYDRLGRRTRRTLPLGMADTLAYDINNNVVSRTDFRAKTTTFTYDSMNRLLSKNPDASLNEPSVTYTYTVTGQRASMTDRTGVTTYQYDSRDRLIGKATPFGKLTYTYDAAGNLVSLRSSNANGVSVSYTYDALNRLSQVEDERATSGTSSYTYDDNNNLASTLYPNGVQTTYTYNSLDRLTSLSVGNGATLASYAYTLGAAGNRLSVTEHDGRRVNYTYDALYRLTDESISGHPVSGVITHAYDAVGNRLGRASTISAVPPSSSAYDANDRLTSHTYDANGNTTASGSDLYTYDFEDRLTGINGGAVTYTYDGDGNRVGSTAGGVTTKYLIDDRNLTGHEQVVEELVGDSVVRSYTYGHDLISQNQLIGGAWAQSFYGYDGHGSVRVLTDASGAITDTYTYDAFGNLIGRTGSTPNEYLYAGERFDANVGFYHLRARYMNPDSGRFQTMDTFEGEVFEPLTLHKYLYANADPANKIDPSGHMAAGEATVASLSYSQRIGIMLMVSYPRVVRAGAFVVDAMMPIEVAGALGGGLSGAVGVGLIGHLASKELPVWRIALERAVGIDKAKIGVTFENWVGTVLTSAPSRLPVRNGQVVTSGSRKGAAILDFVYDYFVVEVKTSGGALKKNQTEQLARFAAESGKDLAFIFLREPTETQMRLLQTWITKAAPSVKVNFCHLYK